MSTPTHLIWDIDDTHLDDFIEGWTECTSHNDGPQEIWVYWAYNVGKVSEQVKEKYDIEEQVKFVLNHPAAFEGRYLDITRKLLPNVTYETRYRYAQLPSRIDQETGNYGLSTFLKRDKDGKWVAARTRRRDSEAFQFFGMEDPKVTTRISYEDENKYSKRAVVNDTWVGGARRRRGLYL